MTAAIAPMLVAALVWGYAISTSIFAIRRMWVLVGYFLAMTVVPFVLGLSIAFLLATQYIPRSQQIPLLCLVAFAALAVSVGIVLATYTRALNREWG